jgi:hypothetical protein
VQRALTGEGIAHIPLVHPAARGKIRLRANYIAHVVAMLQLRPMTGFTARGSTTLRRCCAAHPQRPGQ